MRLEPRSALSAPFGAVSAVAGFPSGDLVLRERSDFGCVLLSAATDAAVILVPASKALDVELPLAAGAVKVNDGRLAQWLSPRSWLIQCRLGEEAVLAARVGAAFPDNLAHAVPFTDFLCWFDLSGAGSADLLKEGGFVSLERNGLPIGHAKRTLIAGVAAVVLREGENVWLIGVERSRACYFSEWASVSARRPA